MCPNAPLPYMQNGSKKICVFITVCKIKKEIYINYPVYYAI